MYIYTFFTYSIFSLVPSFLSGELILFCAFLDESQKMKGLTFLGRLLFLFWLLLMEQHPAHGAAPCTESTQRQALVQFYNATSGDRWQRRSHWLRDSTSCGSGLPVSFVLSYILDAFTFRTPRTPATAGMTHHPS